MSFNYKVSCMSAVADVSRPNHGNFFCDGKSMKRDNTGLSAPLVVTANSDSEQCVGVFSSSLRPSDSHYAIKALRFFLKQKSADDIDYKKHLNGFFNACDRVFSDTESNGATHEASAAVAFIRYNGLYVGCAGGVLVYVLRNGEVTLLDPPENACRELGGTGRFELNPVIGELMTGDRIVICTAELKRAIPDERFMTLLMSVSGTDNAAEMLVNDAVRSGGADSATVAVIDIEDETSRGYWILPALVVIDDALQGNDSASDLNGETEGTETFEIISGVTGHHVPEKNADFSENGEEFFIETPQNDDPQAEDDSRFEYAPTEQQREFRTVDSTEKQDKKKKNVSIAISIIVGVLVLGLLLTMAILMTSKDKNEPSVTVSTDKTTATDSDSTNNNNNAPATDAPETSDESDTAQTSDTETTKPEDTETETETDTTEPATSDSEEPAGNDLVGKTSKGYEITYSDGAYHVNVNGTDIIVANKTYALDPSYNPEGLTSATQTAFNKLIGAAKADGCTIYSVSEFRSYKKQESLYNNYVARDGKAEADRYSARPGHSEHQTGMAIDVNSVDQSFENTAEGKWIAAHCSEFGFILRYPKEKEGVTGYMYEPWHIRYVGPIAADIAASGLTLEEYLGVDSVYAE